MRRKCHPEYRAFRGDYALHKYRESSDAFGSVAKKKKRKIIVIKKFYLIELEKRIVIFEFLFSFNILDRIYFNNV